MTYISGSIAHIVDYKPTSPSAISPLAEVGNNHFIEKQSCHVPGAMFKLIRPCTAPGDWTIHPCLPVNKSIMPNRGRSMLAGLASSTRRFDVFNVQRVQCLMCTVHQCSPGVSHQMNSASTNAPGQ